MKKATAFLLVLITFALFSFPALTQSKEGQKKGKENKLSEKMIWQLKQGKHPFKVLGVELYGAMKYCLKTFRTKKDFEQAKVKHRYYDTTKKRVQRKMIHEFKKKTGEKAKVGIINDGEEGEGYKNEDDLAYVEWNAMASEDFVLRGPRALVYIKYGKGMKKKAKLKFESMERLHSFLHQANSIARVK